MVGAELAMLYAPGVPIEAGIAVTIAAIVGAVLFTRWWPAPRRAALSRPRPGA